MIAVNVKQLVEAIEEADVFSLPQMNAGTEYLYSNLYGRLSRGDEVTLSSLDFDAFESVDITSLNSLYSDVFERNSYTASSIISTLRRAAPVCKTVGYV